MIARIALASLTASALASCVASRPTLEPEPGGVCRGEPVQAFVGQIASEELGRRMLQASGAGTLRWVALGQLVTMEFRADRLTVKLGAADQVLSATCG